MANGAMVPRAFSTTDPTVNSTTTTTNSTRQLEPRRKRERVTSSWTPDAIMDVLRGDETFDSWCNGSLLCTPVVHVQPTEETERMTLSFPVQQDSFEALCKAANPSPFGRGDDTVIDPAYRSTLHIPADRLTIEGTEFDTELNNAVKRISTLLRVEEGTVAKLYQLLLYRVGDHFDWHVDSAKMDGMWGTLVMVLPSSYDGGGIQFRHAGQHGELLKGGDESSVRFAAWFSNVTHKLNRVESGFRVALIYNLIMPPSPFSQQQNENEQQNKIAEEKNVFGVNNLVRLKQLVKEWEEQAPEEFIVFPASHEYSAEQVDFINWNVGKPAMLKGSDLAAVRLASLSGELVAFVGHYEHREVLNTDNYDGMYEWSAESIDDDIEGNVRERGIDTWDDETVFSDWAKIKLGCDVAIRTDWTEEEVEAFESACPGEQTSKGGDYTGNCSESIVRRYRSSVLFIARKRSGAFARRLHLLGMVLLTEQGRIDFLTFLGYLATVVRPAALDCPMRFDAKPKPNLISRLLSLFLRRARDLSQKQMLLDALRRLKQPLQVVAVAAATLKIPFDFGSAIDKAAPNELLSLLYHSPWNASYSLAALNRIMQSSVSHQEAFEMLCAIGEAEVPDIHLKSLQQIVLSSIKNNDCAEDVMRCLLTCKCSSRLTNIAEAVLVEYAAKIKRLEEFMARNEGLPEVFWDANRSFPCSCGNCSLVASFLKKPGSNPAQLRIKTGSPGRKHLYGVLSGLKVHTSKDVTTHPHTLVITKAPTALAGEKKIIS